MKKQNPSRSENMERLLRKLKNTNPVPSPLQTYVSSSRQSKSPSQLKSKTHQSTEKEVDKYQFLKNFDNFENYQQSQRKKAEKQFSTTPKQQRVTQKTQNARSVTPKLLKTKPDKSETPIKGAKQFESITIRQPKHESSKVLTPKIDTSRQEQSKKESSKPDINAFKVEVRVENVKIFKTEEKTPLRENRRQNETKKKPNPIKPTPVENTSPINKRSQENRSPMVKATKAEKSAKEQPNQSLLMSPISQGKDVLIFYARDSQSPLLSTTSLFDTVEHPPQQMEMTPKPEPQETLKKKRRTRGERKSSVTQINE